jgi:hypothetical protein
MQSATYRLCNTGPIQDRQRHIIVTAPDPFDVIGSVPAAYHLANTGPIQGHRHYIPFGPFETIGRILDWAHVGFSEIIGLF